MTTIMNDRNIKLSFTITIVITFSQKSSMNAKTAGENLGGPQYLQSLKVSLHRLVYILLH